MMIAQYPRTAGMTLIQQITVGTPVAAVTFSNIPQTYTNLRLMGNYSITSGTSLALNFNGDVTNNYTWARINQTNGTPSYTFAAGSTDTKIILGSSSGGITADILNYVLGSFRVFVNSLFSSMAVGGNSTTGTGGGMWQANFANVITLTDTGGALFATGTEFSLYGIS